ncbi:MAG TPA: GH92 family glycosyl hydrolase [Bacteroidales bacterium]|nr:GH92 family glycosyl hydrolase [Bacteroidales bacterium]
MTRYFLILLFPSLVAAQTPYKYVDPLIGTGTAKTAAALKHGSGTESKGQTFPAVGRPFGMTQWTPETRTTELKCVAPYYYNDKYITGFRGSHWMSGSCTQDYGSITLMPFTTGNTDTLKHIQSSKFNHKNEISQPAYYRVTLDNSGIIAELAGSVRSGIMRFSFPGKNPGFIFIRMNSDENEGRIWIDSKNNEIRGFNPVHRIYQGNKKKAGFSGYFVIRFNKPFHLIDQLRTNQQIVVGIENEKSVIVKTGTSFTSLEAAAANLDSEIPVWDFEAIRKEGEDTWNRTLGKVIAGEGTDEDKIKFYTALYHCYQLPRIASDKDGSYPGFADDTLIRKTTGFDYYDDFSMWDTYRALHPLMTILEPQKTLDMIRSLVLKAEQGGWMPIFPAWANYTAAMIGDHVSTTIADAYLKGIKDFDAEKAYLYMRKNAFENPSVEEYKDGKGRRALKSYLQYGYIPLEDSVADAFHKNEQVSRTLEYAFDDFALARFAGELGHSEDHDILMKRSENWKNVFDVKSSYVRGRQADGKWIEPFDPLSKAQYICEGTPYQYTWYVPHDIPGLIHVFGSQDLFLERLNDFFDKGHYWHGNETDQQAPYIFTLAGRPEKTQELTTRIIGEEYGTGPGGLSGNEDAGQMSAWLVFSMMGFYPVCPASNRYVITKPSFDEVRIILPGGKYFLISQVKQQNSGKRIKAISLNGGRYNDWFINHEDIIKGGRFTFLIE